MYDNPEDHSFMRRSKWFCILFVVITLFIATPFFLFHWPAHTETIQFRQKIRLWDSSFFFAANFYNNEDVLPHWTKEFVKLAQIIGYERVYLSIYENNSGDNTKMLLEDLRATLTSLNIRHTITAEINNLRDQHPERIEYLALVRNMALEPLFTLLENSTKSNGGYVDPYMDSLVNSKHSKVVFLNDIYFKAIDMVRLISTRRFSYDIACGLDFYTLFYDHYATRDINGNWFANVFPYSREEKTQQMARRGEEFPVYSCWNGAASMAVQPFSKYHLKFRSNEPDATCIHSECFLICEDFRNLNFTDVYINPNVKVTYQWSDYLFQQYIMPIADIFFALFYYPTPIPTPEGGLDHRSNNFDVQCAIPPEEYL